MVFMFFNFFFLFFLSLCVCVRTFSKTLALKQHHQQQQHHYHTHITNKTKNKTMQNNFPYNKCKHQQIYTHGNGCAVFSGYSIHPPINPSTHRKNTQHSFTIPFFHVLGFSGIKLGSLSKQKPTNNHCRYHTTQQHLHHQHCYPCYASPPPPDA